MSGLIKVRWPGRGQIVKFPKGFPHLRFFLDGAHSPESLQACGKWFFLEAKLTADPLQISSGILSGSDPKGRTLIFNCTNTRIPEILLQNLEFGIHSELDFSAGDPRRYKLLDVFDYILIVPSMIESLHPNNKKGLVRPSLPQSVQTFFHKLDYDDPACRVKAFSSFREAAIWLEHKQNSLVQDVLVTGSLYLVGDALKTFSINLDAL